MKVNISLILKISAQPKDDRYGLDMGKKYPVSNISMGQSNTTVYLENLESYNAIHFRYFLGDKEIDIWKSGLINDYRTLHLPGIWYMDGKDGRL